MPPTDLNFSPVGASAMMVRFGTTLDEATHGRVLAWDAALGADPPPGFIEAVPAYTTLLVHFDPLVTDHAAIEAHLRGLSATSIALSPATHVVDVTYGGASGPDLTAAADALGLEPEAVVERHLAGDYRVYMYGFAPGYAYLGGVPADLRLPRKPRAVSGIPAGSVMIAGPQCLVTTLAMPSGWWVVGRSDARIFEPFAERPFRFAPGDRVRFRRA